MARGRVLDFGSTCLPPSLHPWPCRACSLHQLAGLPGPDCLAQTRGGVAGALRPFSSASCFCFPWLLHLLALLGCLPESRLPGCPGEGFRSTEAMLPDLQLLSPTCCWLLFVLHWLAASLDPDCLVCSRGGVLEHRGLSPSLLLLSPTAVGSFSFCAGWLPPWIPIAWVAPGVWFQDH